MKWVIISILDWISYFSFISFYFVIGYILACVGETIYKSF